MRVPRFTSRGLGSLFRGIHIPVLDHDPDNSKRIRDDGPVWRLVDIHLAAVNKDTGADEENKGAHEICGPEPDVALHVRRGKHAQTPKVDAAVKDRVDALDSRCRRDDNTLSFRSGVDGHFSPGVLVGDQGGDVCFDSSSSEADKDNRGNESTEASAILQGYG